MEIRKSNEEYVNLNKIKPGRTFRYPQNNTIYMCGWDDSGTKYIVNIEDGRIIREPCYNEVIPVEIKGAYVD